MSDQIRIAVLDRGHVLVGRCPDPESVGLWLRITDARMIRRWGTTRGLAQLQAGPTAETVLDDVMPCVTLPIRALLYTIDCEESRWAPHLTPPFAAAATRR